MCANRFCKLMIAYLLALTLCLWLAAPAIAAPVADLTPTAEPPTPTVEPPTATSIPPTETPIPATNTPEPTATPVVVPTNTPEPTATAVAPTPTAVVVDEPDDDGEEDPAPTNTPQPVQPTATNTPPPTPNTMPVTGGDGGADGLAIVFGFVAIMALVFLAEQVYARYHTSGH